MGPSHLISSVSMETGTRRPSRFPITRAHMLRWGVPLAVLIVSALLGWRADSLMNASRSGMALLVLAAAPLAYVVLQFFVQRRELVPVAILFTALFLPVFVPVRGSALVLSLVLTVGFIGLWLIRMMVIDRKFSLAPSPANLPLLGFMVTVVISLIWSGPFRDVVVATWPSFPFVQILSSLVMVALPGLFLLVSNYLTDIKLWKIMVGVMLVAGVIGLANEFFRPIIPVQTRGTFTMWVVSLLVAKLLFQRGLNAWLRIGFLALVLGWGYWSFVLRVTWLVSWLPTLVVLVVLTFMRSKKLLFLLALAGTVWAVINASFVSAVITAEEQESGQTRVAAWLQNWEITRDHLLFGVGPAGYAAYYMTYFPRDAMATHSNYVDIVSQLGLTGFLFYMAFFGVTAWQGFRLCERLRGRGDFTEALAQAAFAGTIGGIVTNAIGDWLIPFAYTQGIAGFDYAAFNWIFMACIPVLDRLTRDDESRTVSHA